MGAVLIGVDPAKRSNTIEVINTSEKTLATGRFGNSTVGYREMRALARKWSDRVWVIEGATGVGLHLAQRLVSDGERVVDVPAKLSTRVRAMDTGHGRKSDPADAHAVAVVGLRSSGLREVCLDDETVALKLMSERRSDLVRSRTQAMNRLHQILMQLIASGAPKQLTVAQAKALVASVRPRDAVGKTRRQLAVDLIDDVVILDRKIKAMEARLSEAVEHDRGDQRFGEDVGDRSLRQLHGRVSGDARAGQEVAGPGLGDRGRDRCRSASGAASGL